MDSNVSGSATSLTTNLARFANIYSSSRAMGSAVTNDQIPMSNSGTVKNLYAQTANAPGVGITRTFTLYKNGVATTLTATTAANGTTASDTSNSVTYVAGDLLSVVTTASGTTAATGGIAWTLMLSAAANVSQVGSVSGANIATGANTYMGLMGTNAADAAAANVEQVCPTAGTFKNLYIQLNGAPTAGKSYAFTLYKNGSPTALTATVADTATTANDTNGAHAVSVSATDTLYIEIVPTGTPTARQAVLGIEFDPTTNGESLLMHGGEGTLNNTSTRYVSINGDSDPNATESNVYSLSQACVIRNLYVKLSAAPNGASKSRQFQVSVNASAGNPSVTISNASTTGNDTTNSVGATAGQTVSVLSTPAGTPDTAFAEVSCVSFIGATTNPASNFFMLFN